MPLTAAQEAQIVAELCRQYTDASTAPRDQLAKFEWDEMEFPQGRDGKKIWKPFVKSKGEHVDPEKWTHKKVLVSTPQIVKAASTTPSKMCAFGDQPKFYVQTDDDDAYNRELGVLLGESKYTYLTANKKRAQRFAEAAYAKCEAKAAKGGLSGDALTARALELLSELLLEHEEDPMSRAQTGFKAGKLNISLIRPDFKATPGSAISSSAAAIFDDFISAAEDDADRQLVEGWRAQVDQSRSTQQPRTFTFPSIFDINGNAVSQSRLQNELVGAKIVIVRELAPCKMQSPVGTSDPKATKNCRVNVEVIAIYVLEFGQKRLGGASSVGGINLSRFVEADKPSEDAVGDDALMAVAEEEEQRADEVPTDDDDTQRAKHTIEPDEGVVSPKKKAKKAKKRSKAE